MIDREALRALIRDVVTAEVTAARRGTAGERPAAETVVRIAGDADLAAFARQVLALAADPAVRAAIEAGRHPFRLAGGGAPAAAAGAPRSAGAGPARAATPRPAGPARIGAGVVTEKTLAGLGRGVSVLQVGPEVAVTPLARDKARSLGITIERIRP